MKLKVLISLLFLVPLFYSCSSSFQLLESKSGNYRINDKVDESDAELLKIIEPYKKKLDLVMEKEIGTFARNLNKAKPESLLGNFVADVIMQEVQELTDLNIDFALQNYGGIRIGEIAAGPVTTGKIYELMPFENNCVLLDIRGDSLLLFFERIDDYGGWPLSKEVAFTIDTNGSYQILINGEELNADKIYRIALPDYVANGGDSCYFFKECHRYNTGVLIRDMIIDHIKKENKKGKKLDSRLDGRMKYIK